MAPRDEDQAAEPLAERRAVNPFHHVHSNVGRSGGAPRQNAVVLLDSR
jgi:hypothetical protein